MGKVHLDLSRLFNQEMGLLNAAKAEAGENAEPLRKRLKKGNEDFIFGRNEGGKDHVECDSQILEVGGIPARSVSIAGGCRWGCYKEDFRLEFADGSAEIFTVCLSDMGFSRNDVLENLTRPDKKAYAGCKDLQAFDAGEEKRFMFCCKKTLEKPGILERICFPDNCFMKIFAITLEE